MIERRPLLTLASHAALVAGVALICLPLWITLVASSHDVARMFQAPAPFWFGGIAVAVGVVVLVAGARTIHTALHAAPAAHSPEEAEAEALGDLA